MLNRRWLVLSLLLVLVATTGCVSHRMYREDSVVEHPGYSLAFIELDDHGEIWSPRQFNELEFLIETVNQNEHGAVFVLLAHGWNNDASPRNEAQGTLAGFKQTLEQISRTVQTKTPGRPVVGIYLGWRGQSLYGPLKLLTFWSRQQAAARVAGSQGTAILGQIVLETKANPRSSLIVIGHSFGGQIIERLIQQNVASGLFYLEGGSIPSASADLIVLLNPASPATNAKQVIDLLRWQRIGLERRAKDGRTWQPSGLVSITSDTDIATRLAYPAVSLLGQFTARFRKYGPETCSPIDSQRHFYTHTAGHTSVLHSHRVWVEPLTPESPEFVETPDGFIVAGEDVSIEVGRRQGAYNDTPYWIFRVPSEVMAGHSDNWNPNLIALLNGILTANGAFEQGTDLHIVRGKGREPVMLWPQGTGSLWLVDRSRRIYGVADGQTDAELLGCLPDGIDLANVIGYDRSASTLLIVQWHSGPRGGSRRQTEIIELGTDGFRRLGRTVLQSEERFVQAAIDPTRDRVFLATAGQVWIADYGSRKTRPKALASLDLAGLPAAITLDLGLQRLLIVDDGDGSLVGVDLRASEQRSEVIARDLGSPSAIAVDPIHGHLYALEPETRNILRWRRRGDHFGNREVVTRHDDFQEPSMLRFAENGTFWVGDLGANKTFHFGADGELLQVID